VLTGADPAFCAGVDLKEAARDGKAYFDKHRAQPCIPQVARMATPVIGAINGATFTGGLELALGCDFLIASERAVFADTHARVGILPGGGLTARLPPLVGPAWARRMSFACEVIDAELALRIGLVTELVAHDRLLDRAVELAAMVAEVPAETMRALKGVYVKGAAGAIDAALAAERTAADEQRPDLTLLEQRRAAVTERNRRQVRPDSKSPSSGLTRKFRLSGKFRTPATCGTYPISKVYPLPGAGQASGCPSCYSSVG